MIQKILKVTMIVLMILGITFSISNLIPEEVDARTFRATWVEMPDGTLDCMGDGNDCDMDLSGIEDGIGIGISPSKEVKIQNKQESIQKKTLPGLSIKPPKSIKISQGSQLLLKPQDFCVTKDGLFIIPDKQAGNIKIYERSKNFLKLAKTMGRKGYGPGRFAEPTFCFYNEDELKFGVMDSGIRRIFIYDRIGRTEFERLKEIPCLRLGSDIQLQGKKIFVSGVTQDKNKATYDLYYISQANDKATFLLPSFYKYGLKSVDEYQSKYVKEPGIKSIGISGWIDVYDDDVYFVWEGDLRILKQNIESKALTFFGEKSTNYVKPYPSKKLVKGYRKRNIDSIISEKAKMSFVRNIFVGPKYVMVIYEGPFKQDKKSNFRLQFYTLDGDFINEVSIPGAPDRKMWFDKDSDILYSLSSNQNEKGTNYSILEYKIFQKKADP
ncbi:MAG: hypothetical protein PVH61_21730 [Candidatus Aminicenantes bacterium]|jgi:hypothetical protein